MGPLAGIGEGEKAIEMLTDEQFEQLALGDRDGFWELAHGCPRHKPAMTSEHDDSGRILCNRLARQLDERLYLVDQNAARLRVSTGSFYIPDVCVIPRSVQRRVRRERPRRLGIYEDPLPLVVEIWSPSTGDYDVETKLREYQLRGDAEIWRIHPYDRTLTAWRRQLDGTYSETLFRAGVVEPVTLPGVRIELETLFE